MPRTIFITGTGTDVGKTLAAAIVTQSLQGDYWKPIQAGSLDYTDRMMVEELVDPNCRTHPETYSLSVPASPHDAAKQDGTTIRMDALQKPPSSNKNLVIEGAGGLMVPLNEQELVIDLIPKVADEVILVSANFLGSINHTLLSVEALNRRDIPLTGILFNGKRYAAGEDWILENAGVPFLGRLEPEESVDRSMVQRYANEWNLEKSSNLS
jgi:dethiobiotin synthetase